MSRSSEMGSRADLELLYETLLYLRKRAFQPADAVRIQGILDRVEELILKGTEFGGSLRLSPPEQEALRREIPRYCEALTQRGAAADGARVARRLRDLLNLLAPDTRPRTWWKRFLGR